MARKTVPGGRTARADRETAQRAKQKVRPAAKLLPPQLRTVAGGSSYYENSDLEAVWLSEFLSHEKRRNEEIAKADLLSFIDLPGSTVPSLHPTANHLRAKSRNLSPKDSTHGSRSACKRQHLGELGKIELAEKKGTLKAKKGRKKALATTTPYAAANSKISRVLQHTKPKVKREDMQASQLENFYKLVTRETTAVIVLQSQCRRVLATALAQKVALQTRRATQIQCCVRGSFARALLKRLKEEQRQATLARNQLVRAYVARCRRRRRIRLEHRAAVLCQSVMRMCLAKRAVHLRRCQHLWEVNQRRWRAASIRLAWVDVRLNAAARTIQCMARRTLARRRVVHTFAWYSTAAIRIQSSWRRCVAQEVKSDIAYQLNVDDRCNKIRMIASEHRYWGQRLEDVARPSRLRHRESLDTQRDLLEQERHDKREQIEALETHCREQLRLQEQITPRAILGGWEEQVKINLTDTRERITEAKLSLVLDVQKKLKAVAKEIDGLAREEAEATASREHWRTWLQAEQDKLWDFQRRYDRVVEEKEQRHGRVDEQLRWSVDFCAFSGKPDKRRRAKHDEERDAGAGAVDRLLERTKLKADEYQSGSHLACTYRPFLEQHAALAQIGTSARGKDAPRQARRALQVASTSRLNQKTTPPHVFRKKLPWGLLEKMRREREEIRAEFEPNDRTGNAKF